MGGKKGGKNNVTACEGTWQNWVQLVCGAKLQSSQLLAYCPTGLPDSFWLLAGEEGKCKNPQGKKGTPLGRTGKKAQIG